MFPDGPKLSDVKLKKGLAHRDFGEENGGLLNYLIDVLEFTLMQDLDVLNELLNPGVISVLFVPIGLSEPGSEQRATLFGFASQSLQPFESAKLEFEVGRKETTSFQNFSVGPSLMFVFVSVVGMGFAHEKGTRTRNKKFGEPIMFSIAKHKSFEGRDKRVVDKGDKKQSSYSKVKFFVKPNAGKHIPPAPSSSESSIKFVFVGPSIRKPDS